MGADAAWSVPLFDPQNLALGVLYHLQRFFLSRHFAVKVRVVGCTLRRVYFV